MAAIGATYPGHPFCPVGAAGKLFQTVDNDLRWIGVSLIPGKLETHNALDGPFPVRDIDTHTPRYVRKRVPDCMNAPHFSAGMSEGARAGREGTTFSSPRKPLAILYIFPYNGPSASHAL